MLKLQKRGGSNIVNAIRKWGFERVFNVPIRRKGAADDELPLLPHQIGPATHLHS